MKNKKKTLSAASGCLLLILLTGCAAIWPLGSKQVPLEDRINNFMQAQVDRNWSQAYSFFDSDSRENIIQEEFMSQSRKISFTGFRIEEIDMLPSADRATVKVRIDLLFMGFEFKGDKGGPQTQQWVKEKGAWFVKAPAHQNPIATSGEKKN